MLGARVVEAVEVQRALGAVRATAQALRDGREPEPLVGEVAGFSWVGADGEVTLTATLAGGKGGQARSLEAVLANRKGVRGVGVYRYLFYFIFEKYKSRKNILEE